MLELDREHLSSHLLDVELNPVVEGKVVGLIELTPVAVVGAGEEMTSCEVDAVP